jgi:AcrR family transcriptional regulator
MAVYTRFGDKQALLTAMHREGFRRLGERLEQAVTAGNTDPLTELGRAYRRAALDSPYLYGLMFGPKPAGFEPSEEDDKAAAATYTPLVEGVRRAVAEGTFVGDPERIALHLWVVAHGMVSLELAGLLALPPEQLARCYEEALVMAAQPFLTSGTA